MPITKCSSRVVFYALALLLVSLPAFAAVSRYLVYLDAGKRVLVDDASGWGSSAVTNLVLRADRSTREECVSNPMKGLMKLGDRVFINQNYIAWFDFTIGDTVLFPNPPYSNTFPRSGVLAGFWSLNSATQNFRYMVQGPNGCQYPANELVPGSASVNGGTFWWDAHGPAFEHALGVARADGLSGNFYMAAHLVQRFVNTGFTRVMDGVVDDLEQVHYKQSGKLVDANGTTDIWDGNEAVLPNHYINMELHYVCRTNDILTYFRFQPTVNVTKNNFVMGLWVSYAQDIDNTACDAGGPGEQWPSSSEVVSRPLYAQFSETAYQNWVNPPVYYPPNTFIPLALAPACSPGFNWHAVASTGGIGTWMRMGSHPTIDISQRRWQMILQAQPGTGSGDYYDPINLRVDTMVIGNEQYDGSVGGGFIDVGTQSLLANKWYQVYVSISTNF